MNMPDPKTGSPKPPEIDPDPEVKPVKPSAVRLPPGVAPATARGPQSRKPWGGDVSGRPQKDAARRAGKSRKVH